jgi:anaerobic magnesium-protoporphyrin IX monomethyl ester cyclase
MKVLLVNPPSGDIFAAFGLTLPPMGLLYLAAALEREGHVVEVKDLQVDPGGLDGAIRRADLVGITSDTTRLSRAMEIAGRAKRHGRPVVMGGPHPPFDGVAILGSGKVDAVVKGEGEETLPRLAERIGRGEPLDGLPGIFRPEGRRVVEEADAAPPDVATLPLPARHLVDLHRYPARVAGRPLTPVVTSRGCPGGCRFCSSSRFFGLRWRARSPEAVLAELEEVRHRYGFRAVAFVDDNFTLDPRRIVSIAEGIRERRLDLSWWNFSRVDTIARNPDMVEAMAAAGSAVVYLGVEAGSDEALAALGKKGSAAEAREAVRLLKENGIEVFGSFILGNLAEGRREVERTVGTALALDTDVAQFSILTPYPGTALHDELEERIFTRRWKKYDGLHVVFRHPRMNRHVLQYLLISAYVRFYRRSARSREGFSEVAGRNGLGFGKMISVARDLLF